MKYDKERADIILEAVGSGLTQKDGAVLAGVDESTVCRWKKQHADFANQLAKKEIEFKRMNVSIVQSAAFQSWQASAWLLERKYPKEFGQKTELSDDSKKQVEELQDTLKNYFDVNVGGKKKTKATNRTKARANTKR